ncbi:MAG: helix-turn-helix domain-containing protein [Dokdonella sp.]|nr:MAG: helix-turn-helix domain-containing protein [Dokdonella sp.]
MRKRAWNHWQPSCLPDAVEGCLGYALDKHRRSVDQVADLVGESKWTVYKWVQSGGIPARKIAGFEHACGAHFVTRYLAASSGKLLVDVPTGRRATPSDIAALQASCTAAVSALIDFSAGRTSAADTHAALTAAMTALASERVQVERHEQPELDLT